MNDCGHFEMAPSPGDPNGPWSCVACGASEAEVEYEELMKHSVGLGGPKPEPID